MTHESSYPTTVDSFRHVMETSRFFWNKGISLFLSCSRSSLETQSTDQPFAFPIAGIAASLFVFKDTWNCKEFDQRLKFPSYFCLVKTLDILSREMKRKPSKPTNLLMLPQLYGRHISWSKIDRSASFIKHKILPKSHLFCTSDFAKAWIGGGIDF